MPTEVAKWTKKKSDMKTVITILIAVMLCVTCSSCANHTRPIVPAATLTPEQQNFEAVWSASIKVLRSYNFEIDRRDRRAGIITTRPLLGRHWFEFWRRDAATPWDVMEGTLQTIYRKVQIEIRSDKFNPGRFTPDVKVTVLRRDGKTLGIIASGEAYAQFLDSVSEDEHQRRRDQKRARREERRRLKLEGALAKDDDEQESDGLVTISGQNALADKISAEILSTAANALTAAR